MRYVKLILGNIWMVPNTILSALYPGVFALLGWVCFAGVGKWSIQLASVPNTWLSRRGMAGWAGWASGVFVILRYDYAHRERTIKHEEQHVKQQMWFGALQPVVYIDVRVYLGLHVEEA